MKITKKYTFLKFIFAPFIWIIQACNPLGLPVDEKISDSHYYTKDKKDVIYSSMGNWFELGKSEMDVDIASFQVLNSKLSKDKNRAYYMNFPINDVSIDLNSFHSTNAVWMTHYGLDKNKVYRFSTLDYMQAKTMIIEEADPKSFKIIDGNWAEDHKNRFYRDKKIDVDYQTFEIINKTFCKDKNDAFYYANDTFNRFNAHLESFQKINEQYVKDKDYLYFYVYYFDKKAMNTLSSIPYQDFKDVSFLNAIYLKIGNKVYANGIELPKANSDTFKVLDEYYAKDQNHVYYIGSIIQGADTKTFGLDNQLNLFKDKNHSYVGGEIWDKENK